MKKAGCLILIAVLALALVLYQGEANQVAAADQAHADSLWQRLTLPAVDTLHPDTVAFLASHRSAAADSAIKERITRRAGILRRVGFAARFGDHLAIGDLQSRVRLTGPDSTRLVVISAALSEPVANALLTDGEVLAELQAAGFERVTLSDGDSRWWQDIPTAP